MNMQRIYSQRGAAALAVALVLLVGATFVAFFANRTMIFEQRTSANQYRSTKAFELADAGIEWAIARLNDPQTLTAGTCVPASGSGLVSFLGRYGRPSAADSTHPTGWFNPLGTVAMPDRSVLRRAGLRLPRRRSGHPVDRLLATVPRADQSAGLRRECAGDRISRLHERRSL
jgi:Tfp pilus assembly protein PilX